MEEGLIHSGYFTDYDGYRIEVRFIKTYNLHVCPNALTFTSEGGTAEVSIWSNTGSAILADNPPEWLSYEQIGVEQLPGSDQYKYTYLITCSSNGTGSTRLFEWDVNIESGEGAGYARRTFLVTQKSNSQVTSLTVTPESLRYTVSGGTSGITARWSSGSEPSVTINYINGEIGWLTLIGTETHTNQKNWAFTAEENTSLIEREAILTVSNGRETVNVPVLQNRQ